ncbi:hypothetical protein CW709_01175 [Candidatus Bathyarchaeota archaeon]|nr:restriction endonuclease [Candidatus Bathyarchaeota archaeon]RJS83441.1 MAG: hypothetical protein CW709_01175 [Candidatus Bathyarchaeota archaeon]
MSRIRGNLVKLKRFKVQRLKTPLIDLAIKYFKRKGYKVERDVVLQGSSGLRYKFDLKLKKDNDERLVLVKDWKRTVGVNVAIKLDVSAADVGIYNPIIVSEKFGEHIISYAKRRGITLITRSEILRKLR